MTSTPISIHNARNLPKQAEFQRFMRVVALSPNNRHVACGSSGGAGLLPFLNPDGSISNDGTVTLFDYVSGEIVHKFPTTRSGADIFHIEYDSTGKHLACAASDGLHVWDVESQDLILKQHGFGERAIGFVKDEQAERLFVADRNKVQVLDTSNWRVIDEFECWEGVSVDEFQLQIIAPNGNRIATFTADDEYVVVWNLQTDALEWTQTVGAVRVSPHQAICFHPSGTLLAVGSSSGRITIWQIPQGELVSELRFSRGWDTESLAFSPDGKVLAVGWFQWEWSQDYTEIEQETNDCTLWDWEWGAQLVRLPDATAPTFSADGSRLAVLGDCGVEIWAVG